MQISPINSIKPYIIQVQNSYIKPQKNIFGGVFTDIFTSSKNKDIDEIKEIKTKEGNARFDKKDLKTINKLINKDKLDGQVVKTFADTMLDVKSMSEVYLHTKQVTCNDKSKANKEYECIKKIVNSYEVPYKEWPDNLRKDYSTKIKRISAFNDNSTYKIENCMNNKTGIYGAGGKLYSECSVTAGSYYPSDNDDRPIISSEPSNQSSSHPLDPTNPFNPMYL